MGLLFRDDMPDYLNKTYVRFTIRKKPSMRNWLEWSIEKGMDEDLRQVIIATALAEETHKTWYVAEGVIPINDILVIENLKTGEVYYCKEAGVATSLTIRQNNDRAIGSFNMPDNKTRCAWGDTWASCKDSDPLMREYHDTEWGKPCHDERKLFEMLTLEGAQAGLSWATILHKRENYRKAFDGWNIKKIAAYEEDKIAELLLDSGIVRNRLKIRSVVTNAQTVLKLGSLNDYIWSFVDGKQIINEWAAMSEIPAMTELSDRISKDMKKRGFKFVGSTIVYSYMQAIGVINDHILSCDFRGC